MPAAARMMEEMESTPSDYDHVIFHQPNRKFPTRALVDLGFVASQWAAGLLVGEIGNTYAGSAMIGLTAVLDSAQAGQRILMVSYGSGAGADAFDLVVAPRLAERQHAAPTTRDYIARRVPVDYAQYVRMRRKLALQ
jgi:hydroxymethylglutaryl-CoA synthase